TMLRVWRSLSRKALRRPSSRQPGFRPRVEALEDRLAPAVYTVNVLTDTGAGTGLTGDLRYCITQSNNNAGADTIQFNIIGSGVQTITPTTPLPTITDRVVIDGYTENNGTTQATANTLTVGDNAVLLVQISRGSAASGTNGLDLGGGSDGSTIR